MLELPKSVGFLSPERSHASFFNVQCVNYQEHPGHTPVVATAVAFHPRGDIVAIGDKHGRVLLVHFFQCITYARLDVVRDVRREYRKRKPTPLFSRVSKKQVWDTPSRNTPINCLCFIASTDPSFLSKYRFIPRSSCIKHVVGGKHKILHLSPFVNAGGTICNKEVFCVLNSHRLIIHSLFLLPGPISTVSDSDNTTNLCKTSSRGYLVSGSLDVVIVWSVGRWAPVLRLSSTRGSHPRVVRPICLHSNDYFLDVFHQTKVWPTLQANSPLTPFKLETSCASQVAAILQDNRVMMWNLAENCCLVACLNESDWKDSLITTLKKVHPITTISVALTHLFSPHNPVMASPKKHLPLLLAGQLTYDKILTDQTYLGFLFLWDYDARASTERLPQVSLLRGRPAHIECFQSLQYPPARDADIAATGLANKLSWTSFSHICILMEPGIVEVRHLASLHSSLLRLDFTLPCTPIVSRLHSSETGVVVCLGIDAESRKACFCASDGVIRIVDFQLFLKQNAKRSRQQEKYEFCEENDQNRIISAKMLENDTAMASALLPVEPSESDYTNTKGENFEIECVSAWRSTDFSKTEGLNAKHSAVSSSLETSCRQGEPESLTIDPNLGPVSTSAAEKNVGNVKPVPANTGDPFGSVSYRLHNENTLERCLQTYVEHKISNKALTLPVPDAVLWVTKLIEGPCSEEVCSEKQEAPRSKLRILRDRYLTRPPYRFPGTRREELWENCLELPKNQGAFNAFVSATEQDGGVHPFYEHLEKQLPLRDPVLMRRLKKMLGYVAYWCPAMKEVEWIPQLVFGIVSLFGNRPLFCFEVFLSIILWWSFLGCLRFDSSKVCLDELVDAAALMNNQGCSEEKPVLTNQISLQGFVNDLCYWAWFRHPLPGTPPISMLILASHSLFVEDSELWCHIAIHWGFLSPAELVFIQRNREAQHGFEEQSVTVDLADLHSRIGCRLIWPLIRSWLSELLPRHHLETLWDHFFANPEKPFLVVAAAIAALKIHRATLLTFSRIHSYVVWMTTAKSVVVEFLLRNMYQIEIRLKRIYLPQLIEESQASFMKLDVNVTLQDLGWPLLERSKTTGTLTLIPQRLNHNQMETKTAVGTMYPELVILPFTESRDQDEACDTVLVDLNEVLKQRRDALLSALRTATQPCKNLDYGDAGVSVIPLLDSLFDLDAIYAKDAQWMHMAERERVWCADVSNTLQSSLRRHVLLPDNIRLRQKVLAFYDSHLKNLTGLRRSGETPTLQERAAQPGSGESTAPLLAQLADDVELLTAWQTEQNILHLSEEQLAQRRRVIEEEARALLARQPVITSSSSLSAQPVTSTPTLVQPNPSPKSFSLMSSAPASARKPLSAIPECDEKVEEERKATLSPSHLPAAAQRLISALRRGRKRYARRRRRQHITSVSKPFPNGLSGYNFRDSRSNSPHAPP